MTPDLSFVLTVFAAGGLAATGLAAAADAVGRRRRLRAIAQAGIAIPGAAPRSPAAAQAFAPGRPPGPSDMLDIAEVLTEVVGDLVDQIGELRALADDLPLDAWRNVPTAVSDEVQKAADALATIQNDLLVWGAGQVPTRTTFAMVGIAAGGMVVTTTSEGVPVLYPDDELAQATTRGMSDVLAAAQRTGRPVRVKATIAFGFDAEDPATT